uniref:Alpha-2-macroglobulin bait region domain-containing protein n=1 Tax=Amphilophus citrinellus TaxID=61819 RepID=A0A3Q0S085_AMPCI
MGCSRILTWTLCVLLSRMCVDQVGAEPQYLVAIPAVIEAGAETRFCASLLQPSETLVMTVTLRSTEENTTLLTHTSNEEFHTCTEFQAPLVEREKILNFEVELRGDTFHSKQVRKVMIKAYKAKTFVQTDKPIYLPGQTVHFRVVALDSKLRPANQLVSVSDPNRNRIGQWLNESSNSKILQLSYSLNSEAREGMYSIIVSGGEDKLYHNFKVEKYVLPKFDVTVNVSEEVSIGQEEFDIKLCAKYTYGQPVPGSVTVKVCRPLQFYSSIDKSFNLTAPCHTETKQTDKTGCAAVTFKMSTFTRIDQKILDDTLNVNVKMEEEGTGMSHQQQKRIRISYSLGKVSFIDMSKLWEPGSNVEGKVKAVFYNDTPIPEAPVYLFVGERWSARSLQNLTTDSNGVASFSFSTENFDQDIILHVSQYLSPTLTYREYRSAFYEEGAHALSKSQPAFQDAKTVSSLEVKRKSKPLSCDTEEDISIQYTVVGETPASMDVIYLVLARGNIAMQGFKQIQVKDQAVNEGEVSFKVRVSPELAPEVQIVAYAVLPSKHMIADSADFSTEKCFSNKVSLEFTPSSAVPAEKTNMQVTALPHSLCGVKAIDKSVLIKEPGTTLEADKVTADINHSIQPLLANVGLKMATNLLMQIPSCVRFKGRDYYYSPYGISYRVHDVQTGLRGAPGPPSGYMPEVGFMLEGGSVLPIETVRTFFPETWIWDLVDVGYVVCFAFVCFSQGQSMVTVSPTPSTDYTLTPLSDDQYTSCLCANERKTVSWTMTPTALGAVNVTVSAEAVQSHVSCDNEVVSVPERGRIDVVTKSLRVKAEGTEMTKTSNWLLCPKGQCGFYQIEQSNIFWEKKKKGGVSDEVTLSAYITAAFLEMNISKNDPVVNKSLACLKESISDLSNTYTTALLAYVFTLAGDMETRAHFLQHLDTVAVKEGSFLYWSQTATETSASLSVEISSYVLLAKLSASPTAEDLGYASGIIRWLTSQQNYYGGFSSTQDTVVALQALALYSTLVFSPEGSSTVTVQTPSSQLTFDVNQDNKLLYQEKTMQDVSGKYSLDVKGTACASVQISVHYNIPTPTDVTTLSVEVKPEVDTTSESPRPKLTLKIKSLYSGKENTTNMVILDIKMLSGFVPDAQSLKRKCCLCLPKDTPINHSLEIIQELPVDNLKPAVVKIYDYYQPSKTNSLYCNSTLTHFAP